MTGRGGGGGTGPAGATSGAALTGDEFPHLRVGALPQQAQQSWNASRVPHGDFVLIHGFAVNEVPQSSAGVPLDLQHLVVQEVHQMFDPSQSAHLERDGTILELEEKKTQETNSNIYP